ncbi:F-box/LRR-repeat protein 13 [Symbiodinium microadriaticum]|uniref:F-box/LRR-repeat protein 13 n=1 Tax=Symbiodinium microadriaticum TaxID=2951 RepID=A0A1Q9F1I8_SYMMI|nr:F-box/LRR-repeat protein 13 [Symbiodinium microadriaticum]
MVPSCSLGTMMIPETDTFLEIGGETSRSRFGFLELLKVRSTVLDGYSGSRGQFLPAAPGLQRIGLAVTPVAAMVTDRIAFDPTNREVAYVGLGLLFGVAQGFCGATIYLFCAELFPARLRAQGMSLSYNICLSFIGGFAASISQSLQNISPHWAPGIYWAATGAISIASVLLGVALHKKGFLTLGHRRSQPFFGYVAAVEEKDISVEESELAGLESVRLPSLVIGASERKLGVPGTNRWCSGLRCSRLRDLRVDSWPFLEDSGVQMLTVQCPGLRTLWLRQAPRLSDDAVTYISSLLHLSSLSLALAAGLTDRALKELCGGSRLRHLDLCGCRQLTEAGVVDFAARVVEGPRLRSLQLDACPQLGRSAAEALLSCSSLLRCSLSGCRPLPEPAEKWQVAVATFSL